MKVFVVIAEHGSCPSDAMDSVECIFPSRDEADEFLSGRRTHNSLSYRVDEHEIGETGGAIIRVTRLQVGTLSTVRQAFPELGGYGDIIGDVAELLQPAIVESDL